MKEHNLIAFFLCPSLLRTRDRTRDIDEKEGFDQSSLSWWTNASLFHPSMVIA
jgi:hypothetical protein